MCRSIGVAFRIRNLQLYTVAHIDTHGFCRSIGMKGVVYAGEKEWPCPLSDVNVPRLY